MHFPEDTGILVLDGVGAVAGRRAVEKVRGKVFRVQRDERVEGGGRAVRFFGVSPKEGTSWDEVPVDAGGVEEGVAVGGLFTMGVFRCDIKSCFAVGRQADEGVLEWFRAWSRCSGGVFFPYVVSGFDLDVDQVKVPSDEGHGDSF